MPYNIIREDITKLKVDAIVNAANNYLKVGAGVCGAIFSAAGLEEMQKACDEIGYCNTGAAVITKGFKLPAKYVIHAVGPIYIDGKHGEEEQLYNAYTNALLCAKNNNLNSIAFPLISSGIYGYPKDKALNVATRAIGDFLLENDMNVTLVVYDNSSFQISKKLFLDIKSFIDENIEYTDYRTNNLASLDNRLLLNTKGYYKAKKRGFFEKEAKKSLESIKENASIIPGVIMPKQKRSLKDLKINETFQEMLIRLISLSGKTDPEIYKAANIDRRLFSKIISDKNYKPSKKTAIALALGLRLSLDETKDLLEKAGFALSRSLEFDLVIEYFITEENYNIYEINNALYEITGQCLVGSEKI